MLDSFCQTEITIYIHEIKFAYSVKEYEREKIEFETASECQVG